MHNVFFMHLPVSSFVSLLTAKSVNLEVPHDGFFSVMEIVCIFVSTFITEVLSKSSYGTLLFSA